MLVNEIILEGSATTGWKKQGNTIVRKYRCTSGPRKGQMRASPASCNAPYKIKNAIQLKKTKSKLGGHRAYMSNRTKKINPASKRLKAANKPLRRKSVR